jgi:PhnB protein
MNTNIHLVFPGTCREAFDFYAKTFGSTVNMTMKFGDAPPGAPVPEDSKDRIMHTSMQVGSMLLMGCDAPVGREAQLSGFQISIDSTDESEVKRLFNELSAGGSVQMPQTETFWSPLFGMCTDKFGVGWMVSMPGPQM